MTEQEKTIIKNANNQEPMAKVSERTVLVISHQAQSLSELQAMLAPFAVAVEGLLDPSKALQKVSELQPALVLVDLDLPEDAGPRLINQMQANAFICHIPVVVMHSCFSHESFGEQQPVLGSLEAVAKPISPNNLGNIIALYDYMETGRKEISKLHQNSDALLDSKHEGILGLNGKGQIVYANNSAVKLLKTRPSQLIGSYFEALMDDNKHEVGSVWAEHPVNVVCLESESILQVQKSHFWQQTGELMPVKFAAVPALGAEHVKIVIAFKKLDAKEYQARTSSQVYTQIDILTGLANQPAFVSGVLDRLTACEKAGKSLTVFHLDLDHFSNINDNLGAEVGDGLLVAIAERLRMFCRGADLVARLGSDEFAMCVEGLSDYDKVFAFAQKLKTQFRRPFYVHGYELHVSSSIGIAGFPESAMNASTLLKQARDAAERAKAAGRNCYKLYRLFDDSEVFKRLEFERALREAMNENTLNVVCRHVKHRGDKALAWQTLTPAWHDSPLGQLDTATLKQLAQQAGVGALLDRWTIEYSLSTLVSGLCADVPLAFDLQVATVLDSGLVAFLERCLQDNNLSPENIILNIPEQVVCTRGNQLLEQLRRLKSAGFLLSLTHFGEQFGPSQLLANVGFDYLHLSADYIRLAQDIPSAKSAFLGQLRVFSEQVKALCIDEKCIDEKCIDKQCGDQESISHGIDFSECAPVLVIEHSVKEVGGADSEATANHQINPNFLHSAPSS